GRFHSIRNVLCQNSPPTANSGKHQQINALSISRRARDPWPRHRLRDLGERRTTGDVPQLGSRTEGGGGCPKPTPFPAVGVYGGWRVGGECWISLIKWRLSPAPGRASAAQLLSSSRVWALMSR